MTHRGHHLKNPTGAVVNESAAQIDDEFSAPERFAFFGEYEPSDLAKLLSEFENVGLRFQLTENVETRKAFKGTYQRYSRIRVWIAPADQGRAEAIQNQVFKITV